MNATLRERIESRLALDPQTGCLLWPGAKANGYGQIKAGSRIAYVHRVMWELEHGPIPPGLVIDHVKTLGCTHRHCANVAHLELVTTAENNRRAAREQCKRGHLFDEANTRLYADKRRPQVRRICRTCSREDKRMRRQVARLGGAS